MRPHRVGAQHERQHQQPRPLQHAEPGDVGDAVLEGRPGGAHAQPVGDDVGRDGDAGQHREQRRQPMPGARPRHDVAQRHGERHQPEAQQKHADDVLGAQLLADEAARHQRHQQRPQAARDRIGVAEVAVRIGLQQERVIEDVDQRPRRSGTSTPPARSIGTNGTTQSPITVPVVMITPNVASRSELSDFRMAFHVACIRAAASSSPTMRGSTTKGRFLFLLPLHYPQARALTT